MRLHGASDGRPAGWLAGWLADWLYVSFLLDKAANVLLALLWLENLACSLGCSWWDIYLSG